MKKTIQANVLSILLACSLYGVYLARDAFMVAYEEGRLEPTHLLVQMLTAGITFLILGILIFTSFRDKKYKHVKEFLSDDLSIREEDEREAQMILDISRKQYVFLSNGILVGVILIPVFVSGRAVSLHAVVLTLVLTWILDVSLFLFRYVRAYRQ